MRAMVKTYGQMPLQLFREPHPTRSKSPVLTTFRMRIGFALRRFTTNSPLVKVGKSFQALKLGYYTCTHKHTPVLLLSPHPASGCLQSVL